MGSTEKPTSSKNYSTSRLMAPESLSTAVLSEILRERGVNEKDLKGDRKALMDLYNRLILPKGRREYKDSSHIEKTLKYLRKQQSAKENSKGSDSNTATNMTNGSAGTKRSYISYENSNAKKPRYAGTVPNGARRKQDYHTTSAPPLKRSRINPISYP